MSEEASIDAVDVRVFTVPTDLPEADGTLEWSSTTVVTVTVTSGGVSGLGWTYSDRAAARIVSGQLKDIVVGRPVVDVEATHDAMMRALRNSGATGVGAAAVSAVDIALWDLWARCWEVPVSTLLGRVAAPLPVYGSGGFTTYDDAQTADQLRRWVEEVGVSAVKIKIGENWGAAVARDLDRVRLTREVVGPDVAVMVDANGAYSVGRARHIENALREWRVSWFEEPVSSRNLTGLAAVRAASLADVSAGEYAWTLAEARDLLVSGAVDVLQQDVTRCGGFTGFRRAAALAAAHERPISTHTAPALSAQAAGCAPTLEHLEWFHDHVRLEPMLFDGVPVARNGVVEPSSAPGHGMSLKDKDVAQWEEE